MVEPLRLGSVAHFRKDDAVKRIIVCASSVPSSEKYGHDVVDAPCVGDPVWADKAKLLAAIDLLRQFDGVSPSFDGHLRRYPILEVEDYDWRLICRQGSLDHSCRYSQPIGDRFDRDSDACEKPRGSTICTPKRVFRQNGIRGRRDEMRSLVTEAGRQLGGRRRW